jgi:hypothetical protein
MIDTTSPTWAEVKRLAEERLARAQDKILRVNVDERDSDFERGAAAFAKEILDRAAPRPAEVSTGPRIRDSLGY